MKIECTVEELKNLINGALSYTTIINNDGIEIRSANVENKMDD